MPYPIPNWIQPPPDISQPYLRGVGIAADLYNERQRLQQEAQTAAMNAAIRQQQFEREQQVDQQRMAMTQAYQQQQLGIQQQELAQKEEMNQLQIQDAARRVQAQQGYQQWIAQGGDPVEGMMKFFAGTGESMTGFGQLARQQALDKWAKEPSDVVTLGGEQFARTRESSGGYRLQQIRPPADPLTRGLILQQRRDLVNENKALFGTFGELLNEPINPDDPARLKEAKQEYQDRKREIQAIDQQYGVSLPQAQPPTAAPSPRVKPLSIDGRPVGQVPAGPAVPSGTPMIGPPRAPAPLPPGFGGGYQGGPIQMQPLFNAGTAASNLAGQVAPWLQNPLAQQAMRAAVPVLPQAMQGAYNIYSGGRQLMDPRLGSPPYTNAPSAPPPQQLPDEYQEPQ